MRGSDISNKFNKWGGQSKQGGEGGRVEFQKIS